MKGRVIKNISNQAIVSVQGRHYECAMRAKLKEQFDRILVGDMVEFDEQLKVIEKIYPRRNQLLRPPISNIDQALIMIAPSPKPDFYLVDQVIINAIQNNIKPILVLNKQDLKDELFLRDVDEQYKDTVRIRISASTADHVGTEKIRKVLKNKLTAIVGQSGVGKTTLVNELLPGLNLPTQELSRKIERGMNTTRHSEIFQVPSGGEIIDTPGFSLLQLKEIEPNKLASFYSDIDKFSEKCTYRNCNHIRAKEEDCGVMQALKHRKLNPKRYARYVELYNYYLTEWEKKRYGN